VQIGTAKGAKSVLHHLAQSQDQRKTASALEPCAQLEFQSAAWKRFKPSRQSTFCQEAGSVADP
jgi:hypothetical protein